MPCTSVGSAEEMIISTLIQNDKKGNCLRYESLVGIKETTG